MCQAWTSASFQRRKTSWVWFFTFCFLSNPDLIAATDLLASPAAGSEASLGLGSSGRWTSSWKWFVWDYFSFKFSSPRGSKISSWATYCRKTQNAEGACVFSKAKLSSSSARGQLLPLAMRQRCSSRASRAHLQPWSDLKAHRQEYLDHNKQCGLKFSTVRSGLQMTNINALSSVVFMQRAGVKQKRLGNAAGYRRVGLSCEWGGDGAKPGSISLTIWMNTWSVSL